MGFRQDLKMPTTREHELLLETKLRKRLGTSRGKIMFLLSEEGNHELYQTLASHINKSPERNSVYLQLIKEENEKEYIIANLLSPFPETEDSLEPIIITAYNNLEDSNVVSARTYWKLSELCLDPEVEREVLKAELKDAI